MWYAWSISEQEPVDKDADSPNLKVLFKPQEYRKSIVPIMAGWILVFCAYKPYSR